MYSNIKRGSHVDFPEFNNERIYMLPFKQCEGLPEHLSHWQGTVNSMLDGISTDKNIYLMVEQSEVSKGRTQRRPGLHIDGYWNPLTQRHDGQPTHWHGRLPQNELLILASSHYGCDGFIGDWNESAIGEGGDCSTQSIKGLEQIPMEGGYAWIGDVFTLHASVPHAKPVRRTIVRLNVQM